MATSQVVASSVKAFFGPAVEGMHEKTDIALNG